MERLTLIPACKAAVKDRIFLFVFKSGGEQMIVYYSADDRVDFAVTLTAENKVFIYWEGSKNDS